MPRFRLLLSYDGHDFKGWQKQKTTPHTIQNHLEKALSKINNQDVKVVGAGRTDTGVHALGQVAHFDAPHLRPSPSFLKSLNSLTPSSLVCHKMWQTPSSFHAQRSALHRTYRYFIFNTPTPSALKARYGLWYPHPILYEKLQQMTRLLPGEKDFKSFQNSGTYVQSTVRKIYYAKWVWIRPKILMFEICGSSFLKQMVRNLIGTQLGLMRKENVQNHFQQILDSKNRTKALGTVQASGLFLSHITYPQGLNKRCLKYTSLYDVDKKY